MHGLRDAFFSPLGNSRRLILQNRTDAGKRLAAKLTRYAGRSDVVVLGLPRGGVPVAYEIAKALQVPLDIFVVRKLGVPGYEELAMGAIASGGGRVLNEEIVQTLAIPPETIDVVAEREQREIERRERAYRGERAALDVQGKIVILVDDGIATGATLRAALAALRALKPAKVIVAVGVAPPETCESLEDEVDELVCLLRPEPFWAVGVWFADFSPTTDEEVRTLLAQAASHHPREGDSPTAPQPSAIRIQAGKDTLDGDITVPQGATGIVLFAHGSGSSRLNPPNRHVAQVLQAGALATLLFDLLTPGEEAIDIYTRQFRFDIDLLTKRLVATTDWLLQQPELRHLKVGYFGASTGAAAALIAATQRSEVVAAVVSRGGRPDLALPALPQVKAPTLLIVGGNDQPVIAMNERALAQLRVEAKLEIVPGAGHLFEEAGTLDAVARLARDWFQRYLVAQERKQDV